MLHTSSAASSAPLTANQKFELPFVVRQPLNHYELQQIATLRSQAYGRHNVQLGEMLTLPEDADMQPGNVVLGAFDKADNSLLGTLRIHTNLYGPLPLEESVDLPAHMRNLRLCEVTRLAIRYDAPTLVKLALFKTCYQTGVRHALDSITAVGRDPIYRQYENLLFQEIFPGRGFMPIRHVANLPHKVLHLDLATAQDRWTRAKHPLLSFMVTIRYDDIETPANFNHGPVLAAGSGTFPVRMTK